MLKAELCNMLRVVHVRINWYGQRVVSVDGYEGEVEINTLAIKYLNASTFQRDANPSAKERLDCYELWGRLQVLYVESEIKLRHTWLFKYLTPCKEIITYTVDPLAIIGEWECGSTKESLFQFLPQEFRRIWPHAEPQNSVAQHDGSVRWQATEEMVRAYLKN
ncbi:MAG: hypothetical protein LLG04_15800 [Parachlamydia sp.]|nr:hypothetical protein [Parachlamydia sp.]